MLPLMRLPIGTRVRITRSTTNRDPAVAWIGQVATVIAPAGHEDRDWCWLRLDAPDHKAFSADWAGLLLVHAPAGQQYVATFYAQLIPVVDDDDNVAVEG